MLDDIAGVVLGAVNERRFSATEHRQPDGVEARGGYDAAVVLQPALAVGHGHVESAGVRLEARRPDDRTDLAAREIEGEARRSRDARRLETLGR